MAWNEKYWDIHDQLYWSPKYLGLKSIPQRLWTGSGDFICVPREMVNPTGPMYTRQRRAAELREHLHTQEETLNHIFDITFAIAPDALIADTLVRPVGFVDHGPFESLGREVRTRYNWGEYENVTQHDGLFVSRETVLAVELKLESHSTPAQVAKYAALLAWEELHSGLKSQVGVLFIVPERALTQHWQKCGLEGAEIGEDFVEVARQLKLPRRVAYMFSEQAEVVRSVLDRMVLAAISWRDLDDSLRTVQDRLLQTDAGQQTLHRLIAGLRAQLGAHRHTGMTAET